MIRDKAAPHVAREAWTVKFDPEVVVAFTEVHLAHAVKIVGVSDDLDLVARLREGSAENTRCQGKCGAIAALLSRCDPPAS